MLEQQHAKFEYPDLRKGAAIVQHSPPSSFDTTEFHQEKIINEAISEHFAENLTSGGDIDDIKTHKIDAEPEVDLEIKTHPFSEAGISLDDNNSDIRDIEKIKEEQYQKGYKDAEALLTPKLEANKLDENFLNEFKKKLSAFEHKPSLDSKLFEMMSGLIAILAQKLHLSIPPDFEAILLGEIVPVLNKYYKKGKVIISVHPERVDYCNNLFKIGKLPKKLMENIELVSEEKLPKNNCSVKWEDATIEYNQEDLLIEAEKILDHLKTKIEN